MLVGIVAVLSCGAQYVPLDGGVVPDSTLQHVSSQTGATSSTILCLRSTHYRVADLEVTNVVIIDDEEQSDDDLYSNNLPIDDLAEPDNGCYVIYTSGMLPWFLKDAIKT